MLVDRLGTRRDFSVYIFIWSCAAMVHATGKWSLAACGFMLGSGNDVSLYLTAKVTPGCELTPPMVTCSGTLGPGVTPAGTWALICNAPEIKPGAAPT